MRGGGSLQILLGTVVLAACGVLTSGCGTTSAQAAGLAAAAANTATSTARIAQTVSMRTRGMSISFTETGMFDFAHSRGVLHMHGPGSMAVEELFIPPMIYVKLGNGTPSSRHKQPVIGEFPGLAHGKSWIGMRVGDSAGLGAAVLGPFGGGTDPADLLASLRAESRSVTKLGTAVIRGVQVTHYRVEIDPARALSRALRRDRAGLRGLAKDLGRGTIPADVWVDERNLVRRLRVSLRPPGGLGVGSGMAVVQTFDFFDFGVAVRVSAPPADKVADISQLTNGGGFFNIRRHDRHGFPLPPRVSGTLSHDQAHAVGQVARRFWTALGRHDLHAAEQAVLPEQRGCFRALNTYRSLKVTSMLIVAVRPAGPHNATVIYNVRASENGHMIFALRHRRGHPLWLVTTLFNGQWYVNVPASGSLMSFSGCP